MHLKNSVSNFVAETCRLSGRLLMARDVLVADLDLTSARLQVLEVMALSPTPQPVAHIARDLGLTRQAVQRLANEMERDGFVGFDANPHHRRAKLVLLTASGRAAHAAAMKRQAPLVRKLAQGLTDKQIRSAAAVLRTMRQRLESDDTGTEDQR